MNYQAKLKWRKAKSIIELFLALGTLVFVIGVTYNDLTHLKSVVLESKQDIKQIRREINDIGVRLARMEEKIILKKFGRSKRPGEMNMKFTGITREEEIFAKTLYFESGSTCSNRETEMLAWVIRNRVRARWYPGTYEGVCLARLQFSCWNGKWLNGSKAKYVLNKKVSGYRYRICLGIAYMVMNAPEKWNPVSRVYHYYNPQLVCPGWARGMERAYPYLKLKHIFLRRRI